ncbi:calcium/calmodulin-dependent protein kinase type IV-like isoform X2 [Mizuhopecten yessoensis]|uniref:Calcium/calmodulin-dependent protein kinase type IV n=1 Tax=Mizuhopecten yessoensis TaxID=6573 RepID=A0A210QM76_MIZYE|nr:calcium/calmodulin-dependent protein kinase type IV-like isoform X2 [Mizuhopecten yessoensis]OWF49833.1 Calcium/calmodulin-dependent protein kinase type IV [Mizuhopecten yessoensis]
MSNNSGGGYWINESIKDDQFDDLYTIGPELGRGTNSIVNKCTSCLTGEAWAVKTVNKRAQKHCRGEVVKEIGLLLRLSHPNLIRLKEVFETPTKLQLVLALAKGGELFDSIETRGTYTEKEAAHIMRDILEAVQYMHKNGVTHRNIKPENLLLEDLKDIPKIKLTDFGLAVIQEKDVQMNMVCSSPDYSAPEMLHGIPYTEAVDLWSCGVIAFVLLAGYEPFLDLNGETYKRVMKVDYTFDERACPEISENAKDFIRKMLQKDPKKRMSAAAALNHPWVKGKAAKNTHLLQTQESIKDFNARRKFKSLTHCAMLGAWITRDMPDEETT